MDDKKTMMKDDTLNGLVTIRHVKETMDTFDVNKSVRMYEEDGRKLCDDGTKKYQRKLFGAEYNYKFFGIIDPQLADHAISTNGYQLYFDKFWKRTDQVWAFKPLQGTTTP